MSRPVSIIANGTAQQSAITRQPLAELVLANLRLLDLDLREDWPEITPKTFSTKDTQHNQKQRVKCTEWILYRLFELWDPEETRDKLQPFFPPLEPLQSLNLRGALFRCLNELKKNGVLGRDSVLRKTMLDECKGEKLVELLVIFSTVVLRKTDATHKLQTRSTSYRTATAPMLTAAQQGSLIPLAVAHAASLTNMLKRREEKRLRYARFSDLLDGKRGQLRQRVKASVLSKRRESNVNEEAQVKKVVQDSWAGHTKWPQVLLTGDDTTAGDLPLLRPFPEIWPVVSEGGQLFDDPSSLGLLAGLDRRVQVQKERLQMWQEFHENLKGNENDHIRSAQQRSPATINFQFNRHRQFQLVSGRATNSHLQVPPSERRAYDVILEGLRVDIANASKSQRMGGTGWTSKQNGAPEYSGHDLFSPVKASAPAAAETRPAEKAFKRLDITRDRPFLLAPAENPKVNGFKLRTFGKNDISSDLKTSAKPDAAATPTHEAPEALLTRKVIPEIETPAKHTQERPVHEETAADRIISSVLNAKPSPVKPVSLTERTRMSMGLFNGAIAAREPDSVDSGIAMPSASPDSADEEEEDTIQAMKGGNRRVSLLDRTRLSMAQIPSQPIKSKKALNSKSNRESRQSFFPINQFETPGKPRAPPEPVRDTTPTERLFSDDAEYTSVFKSRPRVALSPVWSPDGPPSFTGLDGSVDLDLDDEGDSTGRGFESSPLARRKVTALNGGTNG